MCLVHTSRITRIFATAAIPEDCIPALGAIPVVTQSIAVSIDRQTHLGRVAPTDEETRMHTTLALYPRIEERRGGRERSRLITSTGALTCALIAGDCNLDIARTGWDRLIQIAAMTVRTSQSRAMAIEGQHMVWEDLSLRRLRNIKSSRGLVAIVWCGPGQHSSSFHG